jgi:hypothetical protein
VAASQLVPADPLQPPSEQSQSRRRSPRAAIGLLGLPCRMPASIDALAFALARPGTKLQVFGKSSKDSHIYSTGILAEHFRPACSSLSDAAAWAVQQRSLSKMGDSPGHAVRVQRLRAAG